MSLLYECVNTMISGTVEFQIKLLTHISTAVYKYCIHYISFPNYMVHLNFLCINLNFQAFQTTRRQCRYICPVVLYVPHSLLTLHWNSALINGG